MRSIPAYGRMTKVQKLSAAGVSAVGAAAIALTVVPGSADAGDASQASGGKVAAEPVAYSNTSATVPSQSKHLDTQVSSAQERSKEQAERKAAKRAHEARKQAHEERKARIDARKERIADRKKASRSADRPAVKNYPNNLDGWIREARSIMKKHDIPGSYEGIKRNIIRESGGDPNAVNDWDINAINGVPSKGLLQVIQPTFDAYHVKGTPKDLTDPVANIVAACNYAADRYGSMDNVNSAY
ncbi:transglycosylase SLT domain-containing protein [Streptomyces sp. HNM0574]|uniref:transglycosylase SLT domain-containing protein n=1 Tax=Streptomyces sp. HNM0574 TaxID=2714954 RepID=UPI00146F6D5C|nr:transglycosylase SLT domain-containing protein [Streptomyces sp. HNM0574]NLU67655.1 transglycosylase SLT domain-containing protein [Streptomyces sp. HNM0574]